MNIKHEKTGELDLQISIEVTPEDYNANVEKQLKRYRAQATVPGFRKGTAPMNLINRLYRATVAAEEVEKLLGDSLYQYIQSQKLNIVGSPLSNREKTGEPDFSAPTSHTFYFDCALMPEVELQLDQIDVPLYQVKISPKEAEKQVEEICERHGKFETPDTVGEGCMVYGKAVELDKEGQPKEEGLSQFINFNLNQLKNDEEVRSLFLGKKAEEKIRFAVNKAFTPSEVQTIFRKDEAESKKLKCEVEFTLSGVSRIEPHALDEELYRLVFPGKEIADAAAFKKAVVQEMERANNEQCQYVYIDKVREQLIDRFAAPMPEAFMKRFILERSDDDKLTAEQLDAEWDQKYRPSLKWEFIENQLQEKRRLIPTNDEVIAHVRGLLSGMPANPSLSAEEQEKALDQQARTIAQDQQNSRQIVDRLYSQNLFELLQQECKPTVEKVSLKELAEKLK